MQRDPLGVIRDVRSSLSEWLDAARKLPDPTAQPPGTVQKIAAQIQLVNAALREATPTVSASEEWKREIAAYTATPRELRVRLNNFEITLRIRHSQMRDANANIGIARSWSDLAKHIG
jgi:hypothetical protein